MSDQSAGFVKGFVACVHLARRRAFDNPHLSDARARGRYRTAWMMRLTSAINASGAVIFGLWLASIS